MPQEILSYIENSKAQFRKGVLEFTVLLCLAKSELYATDILNKLKGYQLLVVEGTIYPLLSRLKEAGFLSYNWVESKEGPPRKYYKLTDKGREVLKQLSTNYQELNQSINQLINQS